MALSPFFSLFFLLQLNQGWGEGNPSPLGDSVLPLLLVVLGYKCGHKNVESVKLKARKDVSNIEQAVYRRIQNDGG